MWNIMTCFLHDLAHYCRLRSASHYRISIIYISKRSVLLRKHKQVRRKIWQYQWPYSKGGEIGKIFAWAIAVRHLSVPTRFLCKSNHNHVFDIPLIYFRPYFLWINEHLCMYYMYTSRRLPFVWYLVFKNKVHMYGFDYATRYYVNKFRIEISRIRTSFWNHINFWGLVNQFVFSAYCIFLKVEVVEYF